MFKTIQQIGTGKYTHPVLGGIWVKNGEIVRLWSADADVLLAATVQTVNAGYTPVFTLYAGGLEPHYDLRNSVTQRGTAADCVAAITRPANTTPYVAGSVIGGLVTIPVPRIPSGNILVTGVRLAYSTAALPAGMAATRLHLYRSTPATPYANGAVWDLPAADRPLYLGFLDIPALTDVGSTLFAQVDGLNKQLQALASAASLRAYLVTVAGFTPAANSETLQLSLSTVGL
jgi:hypothetical protein